MADDGYAPWPSLDPWTEIRAVNWGTHPITKLDFVNDRYMVAGRNEQRVEVIDHPEWRADMRGLDLRGSEDLLATPRQAHLKNKVFPVTSKKPGALNEFSYLDYTIVFEFEWLDRRNVFDTTQGYAAAWDGSDNGIPQGFDQHETIISGYSLDGDPNYFSVEQTVEAASYPEQPWTVVTSTEDYNVWICNRPDDLNADGDPYDPAHDTGPIYHLFEWGAFYKYGDVRYAGGKPGYFDEFDNGLVMERIPDPDPPADAIVPGFFDPWYLGAVRMPRDPGDLPAPYPLPPSQTVDPLLIYPPGFKARQISGLAPYTSTDGSFATYRLLPNCSTNEPASFGVVGGTGVPYGFVRVAINVGPTMMAMSVNGGDVILTETPAGFKIPRRPTDPANPIAPERKGFPADKFAFQLGGFSGFMRCMWLYQKTKKNETLKKLSVVRPLPGATSSKWKLG